MPDIDVPTSAMLTKEFYSTFRNDANPSLRDDWDAYKAPSLREGTQNKD